MKKNVKGFTMVELLAAITILGILSTIGVAAYTKYLSYTKIKAIDTLAESSSRAAEKYFMDNPDESNVNIDILASEGYLENITDPKNENQSCMGTVRVINHESSNNNLDTAEYNVNMCCTDYNYTYSYPSKNKEKDRDGCKADVNIIRLIEPDSTKATNCSSSNKRLISHHIYTMNYIGRVCDKDASGRYGECHSDGNPFTSQEYPCRLYEYHQRQCECTYSKVTNRFCSSRITTNDIDNHTMRINYLRNSNGTAACKSDDSSYINSYVDHVCWYGRYANESDTSFVFHGYEFYKGRSSGYTEFLPGKSWFHDGGYYDFRAIRNADVNGEPSYEDGCRNTCIYMTEKWMGTVN